MFSQEMHRHHLCPVSLVSGNRNRNLKFLRNVCSGKGNPGGAIYAKEP